MANSLIKELNRRRNRIILDLNLHDFNELLKQGYTDEEISKELGVEKNYVKKLREEVERDW